jgi:hypothetical protein
MEAVWNCSTGDTDDTVDVLAHAAVVHVPVADEGNDESAVAAVS